MPKVKGMVFVSGCKDSYFATLSGVTAFWPGNAQQRIQLIKEERFKN
jgi:hypothetical protein